MSEFVGSDGKTWEPGHIGCSRYGSDGLEGIRVVAPTDPDFPAAVCALGETSVERSGDHHVIWRATIEADVFIHSHVDAPGLIAEVDLCEVRGCIPADFILWAEEHRTDDEITEAFASARDGFPQLDEAYTVSIKFCHESECSSWFIEEVKALSQLRKDNCGIY